MSPDAQQVMNPKCSFRFFTSIGEKEKIIESIHIGLVEPCPCAFITEGENMEY